MLSREDLRKLKESSRFAPDPGALADIKGIEIDGGLDRLDRLERYLDAVGNPYLFRVGDTVVRVEYGSDRSLQRAMTGLFL